MAYIVSNIFQNNQIKGAILTLNTAAFCYALKETQSKEIRMTRSENRREKFVRLAESRMAKALRSIRVIGNLSNSANYEYTEADVRKIVKALEDEIQTMREKFSRVRSRSGSGFKLS
jgi:hypothetical protein